MKSTYTIPVAILVGGVIVAGAIYFSMARPQGSTRSGSGNPALVRPVDSRDHILGSPTAPIMVIEYTDFDCSYCKTFHATMHALIADAGAEGKVAWVLRSFPLTELHPNALKHAEAAECVAEAAGEDHTAFWKFADALFAGQPVDPTQYGALAAAAGAPGARFATCYANAATTVDPRIMANRQNALDSGAQGTPYSLVVVAGKTPLVVDGAYTPDALQLVIDQALASL